MNGPIATRTISDNANRHSIAAARDASQAQVADMRQAQRLPLVRPSQVLLSPMVPVMLCRQVTDGREAQRPWQVRPSQVPLSPMARLTLSQQVSDRWSFPGASSILDVVGKGGGQMLPPEIRAEMESRLGSDFSDVRVHTDAKATESARRVNALAYTVGRDVVFGAGQYALQTSKGRKLMAHELAHVAQQRGQGIGDPIAISSPESAAEHEAAIAAETVETERSFRPVESAEAAVLVNRQPAPAAPAPGGLAGLTATRDAFNNAGAPDPDDCAALKPAALGVDGPDVGQNGMEMIFRIHGPIPPGTEFDITRTKATGIWQEDGGVWSRLGGWPAGTSDDHTDDDECLTPAARRIFVVDTPGPPGTLDPTTVAFPNAAAVSATVTALVWKLSFAEWVIARNRPLGIGWTAISTPLFHRWHSIFSVRLVGGVWTHVNTPGGQHNEIELGAIATAGAAP